jgi:hypothetical protein
VRHAPHTIKSLIGLGACDIDAWLQQLFEMAKIGDLGRYLPRNLAKHGRHDEEEGKVQYGQHLGSGQRCTLRGTATEISETDPNSGQAKTAQRPHSAHWSHPQRICAHPWPNHRYEHGGKHQNHSAELIRDCP